MVGWQGKDAAPRAGSPLALLPALRRQLDGPPRPGPGHAGVPSQRGGNSWVGEVLALVHSLLRASGEYWRETRTVSKYGYFFNGFRTGFWSGEVLGKRMAVFYVFLVTHVPTVADVQSMPVVFTAICALFWAVHGAYLPLVKDALQERPRWTSNPWTLCTST